MLNRKLVGSAWGEPADWKKIPSLLLPEMMLRAEGVVPPIRLET